VIESGRRHYNTVRPQVSLGYRPPAPEVFVPASSAWPAALARATPPAKLPVVERPTLQSGSSTKTGAGGQHDTD